ncbi:MAG TPA: hypothetical protein VM889_00100 [Candidatus Thermoplasmatota archaeon]|nr:hypothetical protein [Candidatus Thermoplasmatota archaeon]
MILNTDPGFLVDAAGGAVIAGLGVWVLTLRPLSRATAALGLFCLLFGASFLLQNLVDPNSPDAPVLLVILSLLVLGACAAVFRLAWTFPRPLESRERGWALALGVGALLLTLAWSWGRHGRALPNGLASAAEGSSLAPFVSFALKVLLSSLGAVILLFVLRWRNAADAAEERKYAVLTSAFVLWPGYLAGADAHRGWPWMVLLTIVLVAGALLLRQTARGRDPRAARNAALVCFAAPFCGMAAAALWGGEGGFGVARLIAVFLLLYAILRQQALGIDVQLRFAISKSSVAAVFVAVFFVTSEAAQAFFGETTGSAYAGIAAAGALVFVLAPLQRAAERLAERAVPLTFDSHVRSTSDSGAVAAENDYRAAVRAAFRDGAVPRDGERALLRLAERAGIPASRALAIHEEVEREVSA